MSASNIEWTEKTWNPVVGCNKVSAGCKNCYAMRMAWRLQHNPKIKDRYAGTAMKTAGGDINWTGKINLIHQVLEEPLRTKKPTTFFVNSMSDLFHEKVPFEYIWKVYWIMARTPWHTYQVLTKRIERALEFYNWVAAKQKEDPWAWVDVTNDYPRLANVWLGVSVEDQYAANERIPLLLQVPAKVRFLSCEPLLGPVDLCAVAQPNANTFTTGYINKLDWVIVGGESGPGARPMHPDWARSLRDQCAAAGVPFFFKQWGEWLPMGQTMADGTINLLDKGQRETHYKEEGALVKVGKKRAGRLLDGVEHNGMPATRKSPEPVKGSNTTH